MPISTMIKKPMKYGILNDTDLLGRYTHVLKVSEVFNNLSGKFVSRDAAGLADVSIAGDTEILGWANTHAHTVAAGESVEIYNDIRARFLVPVSGTYAQTMRGKTCDLVVAANIQSANVAASATDVICVYDGDATLAIAEVGLNPLKMYITGVV